MELYHHGILKQKWGVRNGPPYPLRGGDYTPAQKKAIRNKRKSGNSIYNKKHFDEVLNADKTTLSTLSYDKDPDYTPSAKDLQTVYRMFNYVIPYDGQGDRWKGHDVYVQRTKFFNECKKAGYGALLDTNDAIYGGFKAKSPIIVFDMEQVIPKDTYRTKLSEQKFSTLVFLGRKALGL